MPAKSNFSNPLGILLIVAGVAVIAVASYNYFQARGISTAFAVGLVIIVVGLFVGRRGAKEQAGRSPSGRT